MSYPHAPGNLNSLRINWQFQHGHQPHTSSGQNIYQSFQHRPGTAYMEIEKCFRQFSPNNYVRNVEPESDQAWVDRFCSIIDNKPTPEPTEKTRPQLLSTKLGAYRSLIEELVCLKDGWSGTSSTSEQRSLPEMCTRINEIKLELASIEHVLEGKAVETISVKRMKRAERRKRNRMRKAQARLELKEHRKLLHVEIDRNLKRISLKEGRKRRTEELKHDANSTFSEVKKKIAETKNEIALIKSLTELRKYRKRNAEDKGQSVTRESDHDFNHTIEKTNIILSTQLNHYEKEMKALQVMMDVDNESDERSSDSGNAVLKQLISEKTADCQNQLEESLFGKNHIPRSEEAIYPYWQFYTEGERNLPRLVSIRCEWDNFLVSKDSTIGSGVPCNWCVPDTTCSSDWRLYVESS